MKPQLVLGLSQRLTMTPQLVQSIRLLQLSALELEREMLDALDENVLLEQEEVEEPAREESEPTAAPSAEEAVEAQWDDLIPEAWAPVAQAPEGGDSDARLVAPEITDPRGRVLEQVALTIDDPQELTIAMVLVDAVDDSGYLTQSCDSIRAMLAPELEVSAAQVEAVLARIQRMDPTGFAARDLAECLLCQIDELPADTPHRDLARRLVAEELEILGYGDGADLAARLESPIEEVAGAVALIHRLNPKPGSSAGEADAIIPDLVVRARGDGWLVELNSAALPRIRVNSGYERVISSPASGANQALKDQLTEARWLVRSVQMRQETLLAVGQAIFTHQRGFLADGEEGLKALTLKEVGEAVGVHESTVSRITTSKYVQTPRGVFSLKFFFPSQLSGAEGVNASGAAVKAMIRKMVGNEPADRPLRDVDIVAILGRRGVRVARRTVAKYREAMGIGSSKERLHKQATPWAAQALGR